MYDREKDYLTYDDYKCAWVCVRKLEQTIKGKTYQEALDAFNGEAIREGEYEGDNFFWVDREGFSFLVLEDEDTKEVKVDTTCVGRWYGNGKHAEFLPETDLLTEVMCDSIFAWTCQQFTSQRMQKFANEAFEPILEGLVRKHGNKAAYASTCDDVEDILCELIELKY